MIVTEFSEPRFLSDLQHLCTALDAPCDENINKLVLDTYGSRFRNEAALWKTTDRPHDAVIYRFYSRTDCSDVIAPAVQSGLIPEETTATRLVQALCAWRQGTAPQGCDFDPSRGMAKVYVAFQQTLSTVDVLSQPFMPKSVSQHLSAFLSAGLNYLRLVAIDRRSDTVNLYFRARGPATVAQCARFLDLVGAPLPHDRMQQDILTLVPLDFTVAVTVHPIQGSIERVALAAPSLSYDEIPVVPDRVRRFFDLAPSYAASPTYVVAWSFGPDKGTYVKAEKSYTGDFGALLHSWVPRKIHDPVLDT